MQKETAIWTAVMLLGLIGLVLRAAFGEQGMAWEYVKPAPEGLVGDADTERFVTASPAEYAAGGEGVQLSLPRTVGVWLSAFFTLAIFSFLYGDNVFYRFAEAVFVGVSAAYWMVKGFWSNIIPDLVGKLWPAMVQDVFIPGIVPERSEYWWIHFVPLILSIMLLWRLMPAGGWISRWPLAFVVGTTAGLRLLGYLQADFIQQINNTVVPLIVMADSSGFEFWRSVKNVFLVAGVVSGLVYFLFSVEHTGAVGRVAKFGIWVMMITFGAAFGYTVMGRIALLAARLEFLFDDWLWLIDPSGSRVVL